MRSLIRTLLVGLVISLLAWADDDAETTLRVEVKTLSGRPVERASVVVKFVGGRSIKKFGKKQITSWQLKTNQDGIAKVPPLPQGSILIQVIAKGFQTYGETIEVNEPERVVEVKLNPPQQQYSAHQ